MLAMSDFHNQTNEIQIRQNLTNSLYSTFIFYFTLFIKSAVPFCFENILKLREKVRENLVCCLMWEYSENKKEV